MRAFSHFLHGHVTCRHAVGSATLSYSLLPYRVGSIVRVPFPFPLFSSLSLRSTDIRLFSVFLCVCHFCSFTWKTYRFVHLRYVCRDEGMGQSSVEQCLFDNMPVSHQNRSRGKRLKKRVVCTFRCKLFVARRVHREPYTRLPMMRWLSGRANGCLWTNRTFPFSLSVGRSMHPSKPSTTPETLLVAGGSEKNRASSQSGVFLSLHDKKPSSRPPVAARSTRAQT